MHQQDSLNLLNTLLFNHLPGNGTYSNCAQFAPLPGLVSQSSYLPGTGPVGYVSGPVSPLVQAARIQNHNMENTFPNTKVQLFQRKPGPLTFHQHSQASLFLALVAP